jgi:dienelactone hydrolase
MRSLGAGVYGGGSPGELFFARMSIGEDPYQWPLAFDGIARTVEDAGVEADDTGRTASAREHFLRSSMYWRAAEYFSDPYGDERLSRGMASRETFQHAAPYLRHQVETVRIPFEDVELPGYWMTPAGEANGITLIAITGFDGTNEELWFETALEGLDRGFTVLVAAGPGQVDAMRDYPDLTFRPDYEKPIGAMVDFALAQPDVDPDRLAFYGISLGGHFAIRGAEHDDRIKALIVNSPIPNLLDYMLGFIGGGDGDDGDSGDGPPDLTLDDIDHVPDEFLPRVQKLSIKSAFKRYGVDSLSGWITALEAYNATDALDQITCPSLAMVGEGEGGVSLQQYQLFIENVGGAVTERLFLQREGAEMHCQLGNLGLSNAVLYDWLFETL